MKTVYKTDDGKYFDTEQQAILHEAITDIESMYLEDYKLTRLVQGLTKKLFFMPIVETEEIPMTKAEFEARFSTEAGREEV